MLDELSFVHLKPDALVLCTNDVICDSAAPSGWIGYATGAHGDYSFNVDTYSNDGNGQWYDGVFMPWKQG